MPAPVSTPVWRARSSPSVTSSDGGPRACSAAAETARGPRGLREGVVQDLGRLYRLRPTLSAQGRPFRAERRRPWTRRPPSLLSCQRAPSATPLPCSVCVSFVHLGRNIKIG